MRHSQHTLSFLSILLVLAALFFLPWGRIDWGTIRLGQAATITVSGTADNDVPNQIASFSASVTAFNDDKNSAVNEVNTAMNKLISDLKAFGIPAEDIKTQSVQTFQRREIFFDERDLGEWQASNSITITLREIANASSLTDLLNSSGATNISGPNFRADDTVQAEVALLEEAVSNARMKAEETARLSGRKLGKVLTISEGGVSGPPIAFRSLELSSDQSAPIEPGTSQISKSVTVTFELK